LSTNVPDLSITATGVVLPAEADILTGALADIDQAFGGGLNLALETPQGQVASSIGALVGAKNDAIAYLVNQFDPANASGRFQDSLGRIYFLDRDPAEGTVVNVVCSGLNGTPIPVGSLVQDNAKNIYSATAGGTITGGTVTLPFVNLQTGPIPLAAGGISGAPYQAIPGWDSATNPSAGVTGADVESRADFEFRRRASVALNAVNSLQSIYANVFSVAGVTDVYVAENVTSAAITKGSTNYTLVPHSIYVAVVGGLASDIALAIWNKKSLGADYNGNTPITVVDNSGYSVPLPSYQVTFEIPNTTPILFAVQLSNNSSLPSNIVQLVQNAIIGAFAGSDGGQRARIGSTLFASRFYAPIALINPNVAILSLLLGTSTANATSVTVGIDQAPVVSAGNISVTLV
jgi:uncharacterized phage protein gp47/JayE